MPVTVITKDVIKSMKDAAVPGAKRAEIADRRGSGLILRGGAQGVLWQHKCERLGKTHRLTLGGVDHLTIQQARDLADAASSLVRTFGTPPDLAWLQAELVKIDKTPAPEPGKDLSLVGFLTFAEGRDEYLVDLKRRARISTHNSYRGFLRMKEVSALDDRPLPSITRDEIVEIINGVHATGRESTSENLARTIRPMFNWLGGDGRRKRYGVAPGLLVGIKAPERTLVEIHEDEEDEEEDDYVPSLSELGRIIAIARSGALPPLIGCAIELTCWTVQRRRAISEARQPDFFVVQKENDDGSIDISEGLWRVPVPSRKSRTKAGAKKRPHVIPLPAPAWACVMRAAELAHERKADTRFLFPAARKKTAADPKPIGAMHPSTLTHNFGDLPGCGATPHAVRNTIASVGPAVLGITVDDAGLILDHAYAQQVIDKVLSRTAANGGDSVTGIHYSYYDGTNVTWPTMRAWCAALEAEIEKAVAKLEPVEEIRRGLGDRSLRLNYQPPTDEPVAMVHPTPSKIVIRALLDAEGEPA